MDTKIWSDSPPLVSIRGWFFLAFGWAYADTPVLRYAGTPIRRYAGTPIRSPSVVGVWVHCRTDKASLSEVSVSSTMRVLPAMRTIRAANAVPAINAAMADAPRTPMPVEMSEPAPACRNPSKAEAVPAFLEKGASPRAEALGRESPMDSKKNETTSVAGRSMRGTRAPVQETSPVKA